MKNYLVIGGSSGIGLSIVNQLIEKGHQVYSTYNSNSEDKLNPKAHYFKHNVLSDSLSSEDFASNLDGLVYCPGSINLKPFKRLKENELIDDFKLNVSGAVKSIQSALPALLENGKASIVLFSTVAVGTGFNFHTQVSMCKGAVEGLGISLAAELAPKVRVNMISPSLTQTKLADKLLNTDQKIEANKMRHPLKKIGVPSDISSLASFLLSDDASWITGQNITIDGGISKLKV